MLDKNRIILDNWEYSRSLEKLSILDDVQTETVIYTSLPTQIVMTWHHDLHDV